MPVIVNPYSNNPDMGQIASNLATAIYGNPEARMKGAYYNSEVTKNAADTRKLNAETTYQTGINSAQSGLDGSAVASLVRAPNEDTQTYLTRVAPVLRNVVVSGKGNPSENASALVNLFSHMGYSTGTDADRMTALNMNDKMPNKDTSVSPTMQNANASRDADYARQQAFGVANIDQAGANYRNGATIAGENNRFFNAPQKVTAGEDLHVSPLSALFSQSGGTGVIHGAPTKATVEGQAGQQKLNGATRSVLDELWTGKSGPTAAGKLRPVTGKAVNDALVAAGMMVHGATDSAMLGSNKSYLNPDFEASFPGPLVAQARTALADELAKSGNVQAAAKSYLDILGAAPGSTYTPPGVWATYAMGGKDVWGYGSVKPPVSTTPGAGSGMGITVAPAPSLIAQAVTQPVNHPDQIPPLAQRHVGMTINSPQGVATWDGHAWQLGQN